MITLTGDNIEERELFTSRKSESGSASKCLHHINIIDTVQKIMNRFRHFRYFGKYFLKRTPVCLFNGKFASVRSSEFLCNQMHYTEINRNNSNNNNDKIYYLWAGLTIGQFLDLFDVGNVRCR